MRLIPGIAVSSSVIGSIDNNDDGVFSKAKQWTCAKRVLGDLSLTAEGNNLKPKLVSVDFPQVEQMREGSRRDHIEYTAELPSGGRNRRLILENQNQSERAIYLVNCLVPRDQDLRIVSQKSERNAVLL
jgi:hypothetical protein